MSFLLKIIEGPNKGAEIALPEGVAVTLGKGDDCDIVLADSTLPGEPISVEANGTGVSVGGEPVEPFHVKTAGATAFAIGPADAPWGELKWPERESGNGERESGNGERESGTVGDSSSSIASRLTSEEKPNPEVPAATEKKKRRGCLGCLLWLALLLVALGLLCWIFREKAKPYAERAWPKVEKLGGVAVRWCGRGESTQPSASAKATADKPNRLTIPALAARYGLALTNHAGRVALTGDFATRAERLSATAEAYAIQPGVELDFCDDESLRTAAEDTFALVGERQLHVADVTNRVLVVSGTAADLRRTLEALAADLPKLRNVDVSKVRCLEVSKFGSPNGGLEVSKFGSVEVDKTSKRPSIQTSKLPICGILTNPYPCLVLKNGMRVMEGAPLGDSVVLKIEADSVTLTNSTGRFTWKP